MLTTRPSRSGLPTASYKGKGLHSAFDPQREADRFVESDVPAGSGTVIVIGPGLGYLCTSILERDPQTRIIAMHLNEECHAASVSKTGRRWHPGREDPIDFLSSNLDEMESVSLVVCEWPPVSQCFPEDAARVRQAISVVTRRHVASLMTEGANGRRWLSNLCRNYLSLGEPVVPVRSEKMASACILAGAGPSLENSLATIARCRDTISLWVVGSALEPVLASGLEPDVVVTADPAIYAVEYLRRALARPERTYPISGPLTGARGYADHGPVWPLSSGDLLESRLFSGLGRSPAHVPSHGTVSGTALKLALQTSPWPIVLAGQDFAWHDLRAHARPHVADTYQSMEERRTAPRTTELYAHSIGHDPVSDGWRAGPDLMVYGQWFEESPETRNGRLFRLHPSPVAPGIPEIASEQLHTLPVSWAVPTFKRTPWPTLNERRLHATTFLQSLADQLRTAGRDNTRNPLTETLLRRLALDGFLRWVRNNSDSEWRDATALASAAVEELQRSLV